MRASRTRDVRGSPSSSSQVVAHEGRCRQGDRARRAARRPGTRGPRQAQGGRSRRSWSNAAPGRARSSRTPPTRRPARRIVSTDELYADVRRDPPRGQAVRGRGRPDAPRAGRAGSAVAAHRPGDRQGAGRPRRHRDQPRRDPADAVAGADDGRALVAGQRRRLQGGPHRGQRLRPLLPAADHGGRHGQAGQRPDPGHRRGRAPGDRDRAAARCRGQGLRRPARDARAGREPRRPVRQAQDHDRRHRRRRLRPRADGRGARRAAGRAQRGHRRDGHRDHDRPGPRPQAAAPGDRRGGRR